MGIALPNIPAKLNSQGGLADIIADDDTATAALFQGEDITGTIARSFTASQVRFVRLQAAQSQLVRTSFSDVEISASELIATAFPESSWRRVHIKESRCSGVQLQDSTLKDITFTGCKLNMANFRFCDMFNIRFKDCVLDEADFYGASLKHVLFQNCSLDRTQFSAAKFSKTDFRTSPINKVLGLASFGGATIDSMQLMNIAPTLAHEFKINVQDD